MLIILLVQALIFLATCVRKYIKIRHHYDPKRYQTSVSAIIAASGTFWLQCLHFIAVGGLACDMALHTPSLVRQLLRACCFIAIIFFFLGFPLLFKVCLVFEKSLCCLIPWYALSTDHVLEVGSDQAMAANYRLLPNCWANYDCVYGDVLLFKRSNGNSKCCGAIFWSMLTADSWSNISNRPVCL